MGQRRAAIKAAEVGAAMGTGAKNDSRMILPDGSFAAIVFAAAQGRTLSVDNPSLDYRHVRLRPVRLG